MNYYDEWFIDTNLPEVLSSEELNDYLKKCHLGDKEAREIIIKSNIRFVLYRVLNRFGNTPYDIRELVAVGLLGLIKCVDSFDVFKDVKFATYATICIDNQIISFMKKERKHSNVISIEQVINYDDEEGNELRIKDILEDEEVDFVKDCECNEIYLIIRHLIEQLSFRDKRIVQLYFGFGDNEPLTQREVAKELNISQMYVSKLLRRILVMLKEELSEYGLVDATRSLVLEKI